MFVEFQHLLRNQIRTAAALASVFADGAGRISKETSEFAGRACRNHSAWLRELATAKSAQDFVRTHSDHTKVNFLATIDGARKLGAIASDTAENALKTMPSSPFDVAKTQMRSAPVRATADTSAA